MTQYPNCPNCGRLIDDTETMIVRREGPGQFEHGCEDCMTATATRLSDF